MIGLVIGNRFGTKFVGKAAILGGVILIVIGIEIQEKYLIYVMQTNIFRLQYHIGKLQENNLMFEEKIDSPKLLCLFESLFQQAGKLLGYNMDDFNLSSVIRFFELGITTELGLFQLIF